MAINDDILVERLVPKVLASIRAKSKPVESLSVTEDLTGITSLPGYDTTGGQYRKVLVAIEALRKPATDAANTANAATEAANAAADKTNTAHDTIMQNEEQRQADEAIRLGNEAARVAAEGDRVTAELERVAEFARLAEESEAATASANDTADHPTYIGADNYVYRWNKESQTYDKTDVYVRGEAFSIKKVYGSIYEMLDDTESVFKEGDFCLIDTGDVEDPDNAKLYVRSAADAWDFLVDMSGAIGFTGKTPQILIGEVSIGSGKDSIAVTLSEDGVDADGNPKYRFNFVVPCLAYEDLTAEQITELQRPATEAREQVLELNAEIKSHPNRISDEGNWEIWDAENKVYVNTGITAQGRAPIVKNGVWWTWNDDQDSYVSTGQAVSADFTLTKEAVDGVLGGTAMVYVEQWSHTHVPYVSGSLVKFTNGFFISIKDTSEPPIPLVLLDDGTYALVEDDTYAVAGSYEAIGNKEEWRKIPYEELLLTSRKGRLGGEKVDIRNLTGEDVYRFKPELIIDMVEGTINGEPATRLMERIQRLEEALGLEPIL